MNLSASNQAAPYRDNAEPSVEEVLSDPIVRSLMASDGVEPNLLEALEAHIAALREKLSTSTSAQ